MGVLLSCLLRLLCGWSAYAESLMGLVFSSAAFKPSEARVLQALGSLSQPCLSPRCFPWLTHHETMRQTG